MPFKNLGWVNKKTSAKGNDLLIGSITFDHPVEANMPVKIMVNISNPSSKGGFSVAELTDDEDYGKDQPKDQPKESKPSDSKNLF